MLQPQRSCLLLLHRHMYQRTAEKSVFNYALTPYLSRGIAMLGLALAVMVYL